MDGHGMGDDAKKRTAAAYRNFGTVRKSNGSAPMER